MSRIGFAISMAWWGLTLIVAGMLMLFLEDPMSFFFEFIGDELTRPDAVESLAWLETLWDGLAFIVLLVGMLMLIAHAAFDATRQPGVGR